MSVLPEKSRCPAPTGLMGRGSSGWGRARCAHTRLCSPRPGLRALLPQAEPCTLVSSFFKNELNDHFLSVRKEGMNPLVNLLKANYPHCSQLRNSTGFADPPNHPQTTDEDPGTHCPQSLHAAAPNPPAAVRHEDLPGAVAPAQPRFADSPSAAQ